MEHITGQDAMSLETSYKELRPCKAMCFNDQKAGMKPFESDAR